jgi:hypothetical protein
MPDPNQNPPQPERPHPTPREGNNVHERPEVKDLVEKARAERHRRVPQGTMKTGGDTAGGGATNPLDPRVNPKLLEENPDEKPD